MKRTFLLLTAVFVLASMASSAQALTTTTQCKYFYWFDNTQRYCGYKYFCGSYSYDGLRTFTSAYDCYIALAASKTTTTSTVNTCKYMYWYDNTHRSCGYKQFCGSYMYEGLKTFSSITDCYISLYTSKTTTTSTTTTIPGTCKASACGACTYSAYPGWRFYSLVPTSSGAYPVCGCNYQYAEYCPNGCNPSTGLCNSATTTTSTTVKTTTTTFKTTTTIPATTTTFKTTTTLPATTTTVLPGSCTDSDGGINYYQYGYAEKSTSGRIDCCRIPTSGACVYNEVTSLIAEAYCTSYGEISAIYYTCPYGCLNGACLSSSTTTTSTTTTSTTSTTTPTATTTTIPGTCKESACGACTYSAYSGWRFYTLVSSSSGAYPVCGCNYKYAEYCPNGCDPATGLCKSSSTTTSTTVKTTTTSTSTSTTTTSTTVKTTTTTAPTTTTVKTTTTSTTTTSTTVTTTTSTTTSTTTPTTTTSTTTTIPSYSGKVIIFRDDDVQSWWSIDATFKNITNTMIEKGVGQTIGVIPNANGNSRISYDSNLVTYLNSIKGNSKVEIAMHGYTHSVNEFELLTEAQSDSFLDSGIEIFQQDIGITPKTFIPPYDPFNEAVLNSLQKKGFTTISSGAGYDKYSWTQHPAGLYHMPFTASFYDFAASRHKAYSEIVNECQESLDKSNVCVLLLHHWHFSDDGASINTERYQTLLDVISWAKQKESQGARLMTMQQYRAILG